MYEEQDVRSQARMSRYFFLPTVGDLSKLFFGKASFNLNTHTRMVQRGSLSLELLKCRRSFLVCMLVDVAVSCFLWPDLNKSQLFGVEVSPREARCYSACMYLRVLQD